MISFLQEHGIETIEEDNGRVFLKSGKSKQLVEFLVAQSYANATEHVLNHEVHAIGIADDHSFVVATSDGVYFAKRVIVATGGMTYPQIGATPFAYELATQLGLSLSLPRPALCGIEIQEAVEALAGNTVQATITLFPENKVVYTGKGSLLFTHQSVSGTIVFDATLFIDDVSKCSFQLDFDLAGTSKKVIQYFTLSEGDTVCDFRIKALKSINEAKVFVGGICLQDLDQIFQSKKISGLYVIGESLDITGKTGGYNL